MFRWPLFDQPFSDTKECQFNTRTAFMIMTLYSYQFRRIRVAFEFDCSVPILFKSSTLAFQRSNVNLKITNFTNFPWNAWRLWNFWYLTLNVEQIKGQKKLCSVWLQTILLLSGLNGSQSSKWWKGLFRQKLPFPVSPKWRL